ncbi:hypothetical protein IIA15_08800, partial [candidate division TA06 bacterium]|nr:hypothetical protein [candidate division TA06 bacterium]
MEEIVFLTEIDKEASSQEDAIRRQAETDRSNILGEARKEAEHLEATFVHRTDLEIKKHRSRALTQANLERRRRLSNLKSEFVAKTLRAAQKAFDELPQKEYQNVLKQFLSELVKHLDGTKKVILRVKPGDEKMAKTLAEELRLSAEIRTDPALLRGLELENQEGDIRIRNTF